MWESLVLAEKDLAVFVTTHLAIQLQFSHAFLTSLIAFSFKKQDHILFLLFKSRYKLCTLILDILPRNASTDSPKNASTDPPKGLPLPLAGLADQSRNLLPFSTHGLAAMLRQSHTGPFVLPSQSFLS